MEKTGKFRGRNGHQPGNNQIEINSKSVLNRSLSVPKFTNLPTSANLLPYKRHFPLPFCPRKSPSQPLRPSPLFSPHLRSFCSLRSLYAPARSFFLWVSKSPTSYPLLLYAGSSCRANRLRNGVYRLRRGSNDSSTRPTAPTNGNACRPLPVRQAFSFTPRRVRSGCYPVTRTLPYPHTTPQTYETTTPFPPLHSLQFPAV